MDGLNCLKGTEPLRGNSLLFITKSPEFLGIHLIDLGMIKDWVDFGPLNPWNGNPTPSPLDQSSMNSLKKLWIARIFRQLVICWILNKLIVGSFIFNIWCIKNLYEWMDTWATPFLKFNRYDRIFVGYGLLLGHSVTNEVVFDSVDFFVPRHYVPYSLVVNNILSPRLLSLLIIYQSSSRLRSAHSILGFTCCEFTWFNFIPSKVYWWKCCCS